MPTQSISAVLREILKKDLEMPTDKVLKLAAMRGIPADQKGLKKRVHNMRSAMRKEVGSRAPAKPPVRKPAAAPAVASVSVSSMTEAMPNVDVGSILSNVELVNSVVMACGSATAARKVAEAVDACGGVDLFLKHLELVAGIRTSTADTSEK